MFQRLSYDLTELVFRMLFSLIFLGMGLEHVFSDYLIQSMMPDILPYKRLFSLGVGMLLLGCGLCVAVGYRVQYASIALGGFLGVVTCFIHIPAVFVNPRTLAEDWQWLWDVYQRSNIAKNLCLLGACFHLFNHRLGRWALDAEPQKRRRVSDIR